MRRVLIIGATSAIAEATARLYAAEGDRLFLVARNPERLAAVADDLRLRGAGAVDIAELEAGGVEHYESVVEAADAALEGFDTVLIAHGTLPDQRACQSSVKLTLRELQVSFLSVVGLLTPIANRMEARGRGNIAVISSVAGDRGRRSNYVYGSAKGALSVFLQGLRHRLAPAGVQVLTVKPGFVDTPMTRNYKKGLLWAQPETIARGIVRAIERRKNEVYLPFFWRYIMLVIRLMPQAIFNKLNI